MTQKEIIEDFDKRIKSLSKTIDDIREGKQNAYYKTQKAKDKAIYYQLGFIEAMRIAKDYLETFLNINDKTKKIKEIVDWLECHNKNYTNEQYYKILDIQEILGNGRK